jgi:hypothetical protein
MIYDWRTRGRPHPAYVIGLVTILGVALLGPALTATHGWAAFTDLMGGFAK